MTVPTGVRFLRPYGDSRWCLFVDGRLRCDYRMSGRVWKVRQFFPASLQVYRETLCSSEQRAREMALELAEGAKPDGEG